MPSINYMIFNHKYQLQNRPVSTTNINYKTGRFQLQNINYKTGRFQLQNINHKTSRFHKFISSVMPGAAGRGSKGDGETPSNSAHVYLDIQSAQKD